jgi:hypothetical protein
MTTPRTRFTVTPWLVALLVAVAHLPATAIVKVNALGMGFEHEQPWRRPLAALGAGLARVHRSPLFGPGLAAAALVVSWLHPHAAWALPLAVGVLTEGRHAGEFLLEERAMGGIGTPSRENVTVLSGQVLKAGSVIGRVNKAVGSVAIPVVVGTGNGVASTVFGGPDTLAGNYVVTCTIAAANGGTFSVTNPAGKALPVALVGVPYRSREINFTIADGAADFIVGDSFTFVVGTTAPLAVGTGNGVISAITFGPDAKPGNYRFEIIQAIANGGQFKLTDPDGELVDTGYIVAGAGGTYVGANKRQINFTVTEGATDFVLGDAFNIAVSKTATGGKVVAWDPTLVDGRDDVAGIQFDNVDATAGDVVGVIIARDATVIKASLEWAAGITAAQKESAYLDLEARGIICR